MDNKASETNQSLTLKEIGACLEDIDEGCASIYSRLVLIRDYTKNCEYLDRNSIDAYEKDIGKVVDELDTERNLISYAIEELKKYSLVNSSVRASIRNHLEDALKTLDSLK